MGSKSPLSRAEFGREVQGIAEDILMLVQELDRTCNRVPGELVDLIIAFPHQDLLEATVMALVSVGKQLQAEPQEQAA